MAHVAAIAKAYERAEPQLWVNETPLWKVLRCNTEELHSSMSNLCWFCFMKNTDRQWRNTLNIPFVVILCLENFCVFLFI